MRALVLSAGRGERLKPLTDTTPKPIVELGGRPLIHYALGMLARAGIRDVAINVHHCAGAIESALGNGSALGIRITYAPETTLLGTGGPLIALGDFFGADPFVIATCDSILDLDLAAVAAFHRDRGALATMVLRDSEIANAYSKIEIDRDSRVRRMSLLHSAAPSGVIDFPAAIAPETAAQLASLMYCGVMICDSAIIKLAPKTTPFSLTSDLLAPMVSDGMPVFGFIHQGYFRTVDDLASLEHLRAEFAESPPRIQ